MEVQFDLVIMDRPMVLQTLYRLSTALPHRNILTWDFFLNRFDALFLEAQIQLERVGEVPFPRGLDLLYTNTSNDTIQTFYHCVEQNAKVFPFT